MPRLSMEVEDWKDYSSLVDIRSITNISSNISLLKLAIKELVDNALDESGDCSLSLKNRTFVIEDDGNGIEGSDEEIAALFSVNRNSKTAKGLRIPTRGMLGSGLRLVVGIIYSLSIIQFKVSTRYRTLLLTPQKSGKTLYKKVDYEYKKSGTKIEITLTNRLCKDYKKETRKKILDWGLMAIEMARQPQGKDYTKKYQYKSSPHWFDAGAFNKFLENANLSTDNTLRNICIAAFGIILEKDASKKFEELLSKDKRSLTIIEHDDSNRLLKTLRGKVPEIEPDELGFVGEIEGYFYEKSSNYFYDGDTIKASIPYTVEAWGKTSAKKKLTVFINKTPIAEEREATYEKAGNGIRFDDSVLLSIENINPVADMDLKINIITPYYERGNKAKLPASVHFTDTIGYVVKKVVGKVNKQYAKGKKTDKKTKHELEIPDEIKGIFDELIRDSNEGGYAEIKREAKEAKVKVATLLALSSSTDPFYVGSPKDIMERDWFLLWWLKLGYHTLTQNDDKKVHMRRMHYKLLHSNGTLPNKKLYENNKTCWNFLLKASKYARLTGAIKPNKIEDMRNPEANDYFCYDELMPPSVIIPVDFKEWHIPELSTELSFDTEWKMPSYELLNYEYDHRLQPYHLEIWCEKSTMTDILNPLCKEYSLLYLAGMGYTSLTRIYELIERVERIKKPTRILYISDFDPSGKNMPVQAARNIEFWLKEKGLEYLDVTLETLVLTDEQIKQYDLPRIPAKGDVDGTLFEEGACELDALEAIVPGELKKIVETRIQDFYDMALKPKIESNKIMTKHALNSRCRKELHSHDKTIEGIREKIDNVIRKHATDLKKIHEAINKDIAPLQEDLDRVKSAVSDSFEKIKSAVTLELGKASIPNHCSSNCLYDSLRDEKEQLKSYKDNNHAKKEKKDLLSFLAGELAKPEQ